MTTNTPPTWPPCYVFASQEFNLVFVVFPFLVSFKTMTRDHLHQASRLAPRCVQTLVVIKLYFIDLRQGEELEMVKCSQFICGVLKSACRIVLPYRSFSHDFTAAIYNVDYFRSLLREHTGPYLMLRRREGACVMCRDH